MPLDNFAVRVDIVDGAMTFHQLNIGIGQGRFVLDNDGVPAAGSAGRLLSRPSASHADL